MAIALAAFVAPGLASAQSLLPRTRMKELLQVTCPYGQGSVGLVCPTADGGGTVGESVGGDDHAFERVSIDLEGTNINGPTFYQGFAETRGPSSLGLQLGGSFSNLTDCALCSRDPDGNPVTERPPSARAELEMFFEVQGPSHPAGVPIRVTFDGSTSVVGLPATGNINSGILAQLSAASKDADFSLGVGSWANGRDDFMLNTCGGPCAGIGSDADADAESDAESFADPITLLGSDVAYSFADEVLVGRIVPESQFGFVRFWIEAGGSGSATFSVLVDSIRIEIDPGFANASDYTLRFSPGVEPGRCGDGVVDADEECDDGNRDASDGCSANCVVEPGYGCTGVLSECSACELGNLCFSDADCGAGACIAGPLGCVPDPARAPTDCSLAPARTWELSSGAICANMPFGYCDTAWYRDADGRASSCFWDAGGCSPCDADAMRGGLCQNACVEDLCTGIDVDLCDASICLVRQTAGECDCGVSELASSTYVERVEVSGCVGLDGLELGADDGRPESISMAAAGTNELGDTAFSADAMLVGGPIPSASVLGSFDNLIGCTATTASADAIYEFEVVPSGSVPVPLLVAASGAVSAEGVAAARSSFALDVVNTADGSIASTHAADADFLGAPGFSTTVPFSIVPNAQIGRIQLQALARVVGGSGTFDVLVDPEVWIDPDVLVDTDGDGVPDTSAAEVYQVVFGPGFIDTTDCSETSCNGGGGGATGVGGLGRGAAAGAAGQLAYVAGSPPLDTAGPGGRGGAGGDPATGPGGKAGAGGPVAGGEGGAGGDDESPVFVWSCQLSARANGSWPALWTGLLLGALGCRRRRRGCRPSPADRTTRR